jgi:hypothetical protein
MEPASSGHPESYPVTLRVQTPERFERVQLLLRLLLCAAIGIFHQSMGGLFWSLYIVLPVVAGVLVSRKGGAGFMAQDASWLVACLEWVVGLYAYMMFVSDRFPLDVRSRPVRMHVQPSAPSDVATALLRIITSIPHALVLVVLGVLSSLVGLIATVSILFTENYPETLQRFQRDVLTWIARLLAYHASLVDAYPPFAFESSEASPPSGLEGPIT